MSEAAQNHRALIVKTREFLVAWFSLDELELLCADLGVDPENVGKKDSGKESWAQQIVQYFWNRGTLDELVAQSRKLRPNAPWDELGTQSGADLVKALMRNPEVRDAVIRARITFEAALRHIKSAIEYKEAHDLLQQVELQHNIVYEKVFDENGLRQQVTWRELTRSKVAYVQVILKLTRYVKDSSIAGDASDWLADLDHAVTALNTGFDAADLQAFSDGVLDINDVLGSQISRMNDHLIGAVDGLLRADLPPAWRGVQDRVQRSRPRLDDRTADGFAALVQEVTELNVNIDALRELRNQHERWQKLDNELRSEQAQLAKDPARLRTQWPKRLSRKTRELCGASSDDWARELCGQADRLEASLAKAAESPHNGAGTFDEAGMRFYELRSLASQRFNQVDFDLREACGRLRDLQPLLEAALDQLS